MTLGPGMVDASMLRQHDTPKTPKEIGQQVEELFARMMMQQMTSSSMGGEGLFSGSAKQYGEMLVDVVSQQIADSGSLGLADQLAERLGGVAMPRAVQLPGHYGGHGRRPSFLPVSGARTTSHFGHRSDPLSGEHKHHHGLDLAAPRGTPIRAAMGGEVIRSSKAGGYGNLVEVRHADGSTTRYAHCDRLDVRVGDKVSAGEQIATVGSTGRSTGPHLHFEVRVDGKAVDPEHHFGWKGL
ncbi:MAG: peptidoglycan DD-metalloendopeptidase family protein [Myxococcota bacterium]